MILAVTMRRTSVMLGATTRRRRQQLLAAGDHGPGGLPTSLHRTARKPSLAFRTGARRTSAAQPASTRRKVKARLLS